MVINICPNCNQRYVRDKFNTDFVHTCNSGNEAIDNDDIVRTGDWSDDSGSGTIGAQQVLMQGVENKLFGTRADVEGEDNEKVTKRGNRVSTHRTTSHEEFINFKSEGLD